MHSKHWLRRRGGSLIVIVVIMAIFLSGISIALSTSMSSTSMLSASRANEQEATYLAEEAVNKMLLQLNAGSTSAIAPSQETALQTGRWYGATYDPMAKPFGTEAGTITGTGYIMNPSAPSEPNKALYTKTIYYGVSSASSSPLMVYTKVSGSKNVPYYRLWDGTTWGDENPVPGAIYLGSTALDIRFVTVVFAPGSSYAMLGLQDSSGSVYAQEWTGTEFASDPIKIYADTSTAVTRSFDIAYEETATGGASRAMCVFGYSTTSHAPYYSFWNGSSWSALKSVEGAVPSTPSTMTRPNFVELATCPLTTGARNREIGMIYEDSGGRVYGEIWNGISWISSGTVALWGQVSNASTRAVGLAYENDGTLVFAYGDSTVGNSRIWNGTSLADEAQFTYNSNTIAWLTMKSVPGTNKIYAIYETRNPAYMLYPFSISGKTWDSNKVPPAWVKNKNYAVDDEVLVSNVIYQCILAHTSSNGNKPPNATYWSVYSDFTVVAGFGPVYNNYNCPYFDFASNGDNDCTLLYFDDAFNLYNYHWNGNSWLAAYRIVNLQQGFTVAAASPNAATYSAYYRIYTSSTEPNQNIREWHNDSSATWSTTLDSGGYPPILSNWVGTTVTTQYENLAIAVPGSGGSSGYTGIKGTWREAYVNEANR